MTGSRLPLTRFAPTPSGFLHVGNAVNALLVAWKATMVGARLALRIDDMDRERYRGEYVDDILSVVEWLGIGVDVGPSTRWEFEHSYSLQSRQGRYRQALASLGASPTTIYVCTCSRQDLASGASCDCRATVRDLATDESAVRVHIPPDTVVDVGSTQVHLDTAMGDFVLWRRDGQASYQLASMIEDVDMAVTHIVRGVDLVDSTAAQCFLAQRLSAQAFLDVEFTHHELLQGPDGRKLSKSRLGSGPMERSASARRQIWHWAVDIGADCGIEPP